MNGTNSNNKDWPPTTSTAGNLESAWTEKDEEKLQQALVLLSEARETIKKAEDKINENKIKITEIDKRLAEIEKEETKQEKINPENKKEKKIRKNNLKKIIKFAIPATAVLSTTAMVKPFNFNKDKIIEKTETNYKKHLSDGEIEQVEKLNPRFDKETFDSLPKYGKDVYFFFAENNPTPGRAYSFLDENTALQYVFDKDNTFVTKQPVDFGKDPGPAKNNAVEKGYNKGIMTTPPGIYLFSNDATDGDLKEYGLNQFSLNGFSVLGDSSFIGEHQTDVSHGEYKARTDAYDTPDPRDNRLTNGCINARNEVFTDFLLKYFKGDYGEILIILPDSATEASGVEFDVEKLVKKIAPMIIAMANNDKIKNDQIINQTTLEINNFEEIYVDLEKKQQKLNTEYKKSKNNLTQIEISKTKKEIKTTINILGEKAKILNEAYVKKGQIEIKKSAAEKILNM